MAELPRVPSINVACFCDDLDEEGAPSIIGVRSAVAIEDGSALSLVFAVAVTFGGNADVQLTLRLKAPGRGEVVYPTVTLHTNGVGASPVKGYPVVIPRTTPGTCAMTVEFGGHPIAVATLTVLAVE